MHSVTRLAKKNSRLSISTSNKITPSDFELKDKLNMKEMKTFK